MIYMEKIIDVTTGKETLRPYTQEEMAKVAVNEAEAMKRQLQADANAKTKAALLERLGITANEAALLLS